MQHPPQVTRVDVLDLPVQRFLSEFVTANCPVVVTGSLEEWDLERNWTPAPLAWEFGDEFAQVYNNYFDLQTVMPLRKYFSKYFSKSPNPDSSQPNSESSQAVPYVRWYSQLRNVEFFWADEIFNKLKGRWRLPGFLPTKDYVFPLAPPGKALDPVTDKFPAKGLFISPRGARTSLHVDPWSSCAILCQLYGRKRWRFYAPDQAKFLCNDSEVVDIEQPDLQTFPEFNQAKLTTQCTLSPGEVIYIPHGWYHHVECESDSISLTWNFVHSTTVESLSAWLKKPISEFDRSVLEFFYPLCHGDEIGEQIDTVIRRQAGSELERKGISR